jgi:hypothetical protein
VTTPFVVAAATLAGLIAWAVVTASPSEACGSRVCATKSAYTSVEPGWSFTRVRNRFGNWGILLYRFPATDSAPARQGREYLPCWTSSRYIQVNYVQRSGVWRVKSKSLHVFPGQ